MKVHISFTLPTCEDYIGQVFYTKRLADFLGSGGFTGPAQLESVEGGSTGQLYILKKDPLEQNNLYLQEPEIVRQLSELIQNLIDQ